MAHAKEKLDEIPSDPDLRARAYERETALRSHYHTLISEREEGEAKGRVEGQRETLTRLLSRWFGTLPSWATERIAHADASQLDNYVETLLSAATLEEALKRNAQVSFRCRVTLPTRHASSQRIHTLELQKHPLLSPDSNPKLYRWSRFLVAATVEEFETLAKEDADMAEAKHSLEEISSDPDVRAIAYKRETALRGYYHTIAAEREESEARGRVEGQRETLTRLLSRRFGPLPSWAAERIARANASQIDSFLEELLSASTLEEALERNA